MDTMREQGAESAAPYAAAAAVNAEAGAHPVTTDPMELAAAERAVRRSWQRFPYYAWRYGARGRRFSASDSGWLVTLCDHEAGAARAQARWLASVLSSRGMPQWMLESHLELLREELLRARPSGAPRYGTLAGCAAALREERRAHVSDALLDELDAAFAADAPEPWPRRLPRMGAILGAAVADERGGIARAVPSVESWTCDPARFPRRWIAAARGTIAAARACAR